MSLGLDLRVMGLRRVRVLLIARGRWSPTDHLVAGLIEVIDQTSWRAVMPHAKKNWKPPAPIKVPRPGEAQEQRRSNGMSRTAFRRMLGKHVHVVPKGGDA